MSVIITLFTQYLKPLMIGFASILGCYLISKTEKLKAENHELNNSIEDENKTIKAQNEVITVLHNATPLNFDGITDRMRDDKL